MEEKINTIENNNESQQDQASKVINQIISLIKRSSLDEAENLIEKHFEIILSDSWLKEIKNQLLSGSNDDLFEHFFSSLVCWKKEEQVIILWTIFVLFSEKAEKILNQVKKTNTELSELLSLEKKNTKTLATIINKQWEDIKTIKEENKLLKQNLEKTTRILTKIAEMFNSTPEDTTELLLKIRDYKIKAKKASELIQELVNLGILKKNESNNIIIPPRLKSYIKEIQKNSNIIHPSENTKNSSFERNTNNIIKSETIQIHKIKKYKLHKIEEPSENEIRLQKENKKLLEKIKELEQQLKEKNQTISNLEKEKNNLDEKLAKQDNKLKEILNKLEKFENKTNNPNSKKIDTNIIKAHKAYKENWELRTEI